MKKRLIVGTLVVGLCLVYVRMQIVGMEEPGVAQGVRPSVDIKEQRDLERGFEKERETRMKDEAASVALARKLIREEERKHGKEEAELTRSGLRAVADRDELMARRLMEEEQEREAARKLQEERDRAMAEKLNKESGAMSNVPLMSPAERRREEEELFRKTQEYTGW